MTAPLSEGLRFSPEERLLQHSATRIVVIEELRIAFLPIPKSGCTSMLWTLAELAGVPRTAFVGSHQPEVTRALAIHNMRRWRPANRWREHSEERRQEILADDTWLRFSIVRDPVARLWSAWQSKLLLHEPRFVERFGAEPWFPRVPRTVEEIVTDFRAFVAALDVPHHEAPHDAHWGSQSGLLAGFRPTWVGRAEAPAASLVRLREHLESVGVDPRRVSDDVPRENANPLPFHPAVHDHRSAAIAAEVYADDLAAWGYAAPRPEEPGGADWETWTARARRRLRLVNELIERHLRIGELLVELEREKARANAAEADVEAMRSSTSWRLTAPLRRLRSGLIPALDSAERPVTEGTAE